MPNTNSTGIHQSQLRPPIYLGLTFTNKLQWDQHINSITSKANKTLGFLHRNLKIPSIRIKEQAYFTLARPLVEYASTVWDPYTQTDIHVNKVEAVQRRAARYVANNHKQIQCRQHHTKTKMETTCRQKKGRQTCDAV